MIVDAAPFHEGELAVQERAGARERVASAGRRFIRDYMPEQHREFFPQLPFLLAGGCDGNGQPWATILAGPPGFASSPDPRRLEIRALPLPGSPLPAPVPGARIGLLGIEPHTRRRNRLNGTVDRVDADGFGVAVAQSFGNCPKYIQARKPEYLVERAGRAGPVLHRGASLAAASRRLVEGADTFFIASTHPGSGPDVSHRGGNPGFVRVLDERTLVAPDFVGNAYFNTLGNLSVEPRAGLLFVDFDAGDCLYLAATARIVWDPAEAARHPGAQRLVRFDLHQVLHIGASLPLRWGPAEPSPFLPAAC